MTDFEVFDVPTTCRQCGEEYLAKSFLPADDKPRFGLCPVHLAEDEQKMAVLHKLPGSYPRPSDRRNDDRRVDFRRRAAGDD